MNGISTLTKGPQSDPSSSATEDTSERADGKQLLTRHRICSQHNPGLPSLQSCKKYVSVVSEPSGLWCLQQPKQTETRYVG